MEVDNKNVNPISWWSTPKLTKEEVRYIKTMEEIFQVKDAAKRWIPYNMMPHQMDFHKNDVALKGARAKSRCVVKSRNTSFTTSVCISNLMAVPYYPNQIIPFVRLNERRAYDLIDDIKEMIRNLRPKNIDGMAFPFDPKDVNMDSAGKIKFPNKVTFEAYPANKVAADNIRGLRISGSAGVMDESNFMDSFNEIYTSERDAASGYTLDGEKHFQMNIGTTLKGVATPFAIWFKKQEEILRNEPGSSAFDIYKWQVFDPVLFDKEKNPSMQPGLIPIVPWHIMQDLNRKYLEDLNTFLEEYMAIAVDSDEQFYPTELYDRCVDKRLINSNVPNHHGEYFIGIDVASVLDFFALSIFENIPEERESIKFEVDPENPDNLIEHKELEVVDVFYQRYLYYDRKKDLSYFTAKCQEIIQSWAPFGIKRVRIDSGGSGLQMYQDLKNIFKKSYPTLIEYVPMGSIKVGNESKRVKEIVHTNQKHLMVYDRVKLIQDDMQRMHYAMWNYTYEADRNKDYGHGDTAIANAYGLLPLNFKGKRQYGDIIMANEEQFEESGSVKDIVQNFNKMSWKEKKKFYQKR